MSGMVCPECGSADWDIVDEESEECNCADCGYDFPLLAAVPSESPRAAGEGDTRP